MNGNCLKKKNCKWQAKVLGDSFLVDLEDVDGHAKGSGELLVADMALEVLGLLVLNKNLLVLKLPLAVVAEHLRCFLLLLHSLISHISHRVSLDSGIYFLILEIWYLGVTCKSYSTQPPSPLGPASHVMYLSIYYAMCHNLFGPFYETKMQFPILFKKLVINKKKKQYNQNILFIYLYFSIIPFVSTHDSFPLYTWDILKIFYF